jgi:hypothetical protein
MEASWSTGMQRDIKPEARTTTQGPRAGAQALSGASEMLRAAQNNPNDLSHAMHHVCVG